jgi:hypothetical protein
MPVTANDESVLRLPECKHELFSECFLKLYVAFEKLFEISRLDIGF